MYYLLFAKIPLSFVSKAEVWMLHGMAMLHFCFKIFFIHSSFDVPNLLKLGHEKGKMYHSCCIAKAQAFSECTIIGPVVVCLLHEKHFVQEIL